MPGHPSRWDHKTIVLFDRFALHLQMKKIMNDYIFELMQHGPNGTVQKMK